MKIRINQWLVYHIKNKEYDYKEFKQEVIEPLLQLNPKYKPKKNKILDSNLQNNKMFIDWKYSRRTLVEMWDSKTTKERRLMAYELGVTQRKLGKKIGNLRRVIKNV